MPASFFNRLRTAGVLPWMRVTFDRGITRRAFFLRVSILRGERVEVFDFMTNPAGVRPTNTGPVLNALPVP
jgi:hypothetical protein